MKKINMHFIPQNVAPIGAKQVAIFDSGGNLVSTLPLGGLVHKHEGEKKYSFGALSDIHLPYAEQNASTDFQKALTYFNNVANVDFICISGDMSDAGTDAEWLDYKNHVDVYSPNTPVHICTGNHDTANDITYEYSIQYTGQPLWYSFTQGDDIFIFFGLRQWQGDNVFYDEALQWLYETLEENKDKRCFVFQHEMRLDGCGNAHGLYGWDGLSGKNGQVFLSLMEHYKNVIWFHGHSHTPFRLQITQPTPIANYDRLHGCHSVHIPSLAIPRYGDSDVIFDAEGYVVDVYENGIHLRGIDFIEEEFVPIASYWIETTPIEIPENSYVDIRGVIKNKSISLPKGSELIMNQRYSYSGNDLVTDSTTPSMFTVIIPAMPNTDYVLKIKNSNIDITTASGSVVYGIDSNKMSAQYINGGSIPTMTTGITLSEDKKSADITFKTVSNVSYVALSLRALDSGTLKESDIVDYVVELEQIGNNTLPEEVLKYTNLVPISIDSDGSIYNNIGYKNQSYVSTDGTVKDNDGTVVTGYIKTNSNIFYIYGAEFAVNTYARIKTYDGNFNPLAQIISNYTDNYETEDIGNGITKITFDVGNSHEYVRFSLYGTGENLYIYTIDDAVFDGFSTDLLDEYEVQLNKRWSASSNAYVDKNGTIALSVPFSAIDGRTIKLVGFEPEPELGAMSTWYAYKDGVMIGRIANPSNGIIWTSSELIDNGDGTYDIPINTQLFKEINKTDTPISVIPDTVYISMYVQQELLELIDDLSILIESFVLPEGSELYLNQQYSQTGGGLKDHEGFYSVIMPIKANTKYKLSVSNIVNLNTEKTTLYTLDDNKSNPTTINDSKYVYAMTGVTFTNVENTSAEVVFSSDYNSSYVVFVSRIILTKITKDDLKDIVIALEEDTGLTQGDITSEVTWTMDKRLSSVGDPDR